MAVTILVIISIIKWKTPAFTPKGYEYLFYSQTIHKQNKSKQKQTNERKTEKEVVKADF